ncbi:MAG: acyltransferase family protein [Alphaproteobacteria bacterium]
MSSDTAVVRKHYAALDGLRGIAVLLVMWRHASTSLAYYSDRWNDSLYASFTVLGSSGVTLFFVLSGFLITSILIDTSDDPKCLRKFYIRRSLRIFPLYYLAIYLLLVLSGGNVSGFDFDAGMWYYIFYVENIAILFNQNSELYNKNSYVLFHHFWSLAVEEQFYLVWPVCFLFLYRRYSIKTCIVVALFASLLSAFARYCMGFLYEGWFVAYTFTLTRLDGLLLGALLACLFCKCEEEFKILSQMAVKILPILGGVIIFLVLVFSASSENISYMNTRYLLFLLSVFYMFLITYVVSSDKQTWFKSLCEVKFLTGIGTVSYGVYIFHWPVMSFVSGYFLRGEQWGYLPSHVFVLVVGGGASILLAIASYYLFERPILKLKDRFAGYTAQG